MKPCYAVLNIAKSAFERAGVRFNNEGANGLRPNTGYQTNFYPTLEGARIFAASCAKNGTVGLIFELIEAHLIKPTPIEIITIGADRSEP